MFFRQHGWYGGIDGSSSGNWNSFDDSHDRGHVPLLQHEEKGEGMADLGPEALSARGEVHQAPVRSPENCKN